jgi:hypothetical protein
MSGNRSLTSLREKSFMQKESSVAAPERGAAASIRRSRGLHGWPFPTLLARDGADSGAPVPLLCVSVPLEQRASVVRDISATVSTFIVKLHMRACSGASRLSALMINSVTLSLSSSTHNNHFIGRRVNFAAISCTW